MQLSAFEKDRFESLVKQAAEAAFSGWDFSYIERYGGNPEEPKPWCYACAVQTHLNGKEIVLDMGTGGGEFLASLRPLPARIFATEAYPPNVPVAKARLEPLGVKVLQVEKGSQEAAPLSFADGFFQLIINRHESYDSKEVSRVLQPGGVFITQQVGRRNNEGLRKIFGSVPGHDDFTWDLSSCLALLKDAGLSIVKAKEHIGYSRIYDIRALVYLLKALPWEFPSFEPSRHMSQLLNIHAKILKNGYVDTTSHRFFVIAHKV